MDGEDKDFAHTTNRNMTASMRKAARRGRIPSYYDFATYTLTSTEKLAYLSDAMEELRLAKLPVHGWDSLFTQSQQQQQPQTKDDSAKPAPE